MGSKGYLISFSLHRPSLVFNCLAIFADCACLFASAAWALSESNQSFNASTNDQTLFIDLDPPEDGNLTLSRAWLRLGVLGVACSIGWGFFVLAFAMVDDHLKLKNVALFPGMSSHFAVDKKTHTPNAGDAVVNDGGWEGSCAAVWFEIYVLRFFTWLLALVPGLVLYLGAKLSFFPVFVFKSLDPEHALHEAFYAPLFAFLLDPAATDADLRLQCANRFLAQVRCDDGFNKKLKDQHIYGITNDTFAQYLKMVGKPDRVYYPKGHKKAQPAEVKKPAQAQLVLNAASPSLEPAEARRRIRRLNIEHGLRARVAAAWEDVCARSAVMTLLNTPAFHEARNKTLGLFGVLFGVLAVVGGVALAPLTIGWLGLGVVFPLWRLGTALQAGMDVFATYQLDLSMSSSSSNNNITSIVSRLDDEIGELGGVGVFLAGSLSVAYAVALATMLTLAPAVWSFQVLRADLIDSSGLPKRFYCLASVLELKQRYYKSRKELEILYLISDRVGSVSAGLRIYTLIDEVVAIPWIVAYTIY